MRGLLRSSPFDLQPLLAPQLGGIYAIHLKGIDRASLSLYYKRASQRSRVLGIRNNSFDVLMYFVGTTLNRPGNSLSGRFVIGLGNRFYRISLRAVS